MKWLPETLRLRLSICLLALVLVAGKAAGEPAVVDPGPGGAASWEALLVEAGRIEMAGEKLVFLSDAFLGTPYRADTLIGSADIPERLVINLGAVDCFTFLDDLEALRLSSRFEHLPENLARVRYRQERVSYRMRRHFFTDWLDRPGIVDVTDEIGGEAVRRVVKRLNVREDGGSWLPDIASQRRTIGYIPAEAVDETVLARLRSGDLVGIFSDRMGLDVSHVGLIVRRDETVYLRHASSREGEVVDAPLGEYVAGRPGLVVLRAR